MKSALNKNFIELNNEEMMAIDGGWERAQDRELSPEQANREGRQVLTAVFAMAAAAMGGASALVTLASGGLAVLYDNLVSQ